MLFVASCFLGGMAFYAAWYWCALHHYRRKAARIVGWIESALKGQGYAAGIRWVAPSQFKVSLRFTCGVFHRACLLVRLAPCELPLKWLLSKVRKHRDTMIFQADLGPPPAFALDIHTFRWFARSSQKTSLDRTRWTLEHCGPFVMSTRMEWPKEIADSMMSIAQGGGAHEFLDIRFQRQSPHFSATLPLEAISPSSPTRDCMFENMREVAADSSASLF